MSAAAALEAQRAELVRRIRVAAEAALPGWHIPVHGFERYASREVGLRKLYLATPNPPATRPDDPKEGWLVGWYVRRVTTIEGEGDSQYTRTVHRWRARAIMALNDPDKAPDPEHAPASEASEIAFDRMLECVRAAFRADDALFDDGDLIAETTRYEGRQGFQIDDSGPAMFAGVLCHEARCSIATVCSEPVGIEATDDFDQAGLDITDWSQDQRYLDGNQADVGPREPPDNNTDYDDDDYNDHDFEEVTEMNP